MSSRPSLANPLRSTVLAILALLAAARVLAPAPAHAQSITSSTFLPISGTVIHPVTSELVSIAGNVHVVTTVGPCVPPDPIHPVCLNLHSNLPADVTATGASGSRFLTFGANALTAPVDTLDAPLGVLTSYVFRLQPIDPCLPIDPCRFGINFSLQFNADGTLAPGTTATLTNLNF
jgi:hypothetical protein